MTELAVAEQRTNGALALRSDQQEWTGQQRAALAQIGVDKAPVADQQVFMHVCQRTGLDPFARQIYMIGRSGKWTIQTGIDGFRVIAERNPQYAGQTEPQWCGADGAWRDVWIGTAKPAAARVGVYRHDWPRPVYATVLFTEFKVNSPTWTAMPAHMIAKVAEAHALRKAFPQDLSGLYTDDEMGQADRGGARPTYDHSASTAPVTAAELAGAVPQQATAEPTPEPGGRSQQSPAGEPKSQGARNGNHMGKLMGLIREAELGDRNAWAGQVLGREITSFGQLSDADQVTLIGNLEAALHGDDDGDRSDEQVAFEGELMAAGGES